MVDWLATLFSVKDPNSSDSNSKDSTPGQSIQAAEQAAEEKKFGGRLLEAAGELLMLPKDMIAQRGNLQTNLYEIAQLHISRHPFCYSGNAVHVNLHHT